MSDGRLERLVAKAKEADEKRRRQASEHEEARKRAIQDASDSEVDWSVVGSSFERELSALNGKFAAAHLRLTNTKVSTPPKKTLAIWNIGLFRGDVNSHCTLKLTVTPDGQAGLHYSASNRTVSHSLKSLNGPKIKELLLDFIEGCPE